MNTEYSIKKKKVKKMNEYTLGKVQYVRDGHNGTILKNGKKVAEFENYNGAITETVYFDNIEDEKEFEEIGLKLQKGTQYAEMDLSGTDAFITILLDRRERLKDKAKYIKKGFKVVMIGMVLDDFYKENNLLGDEITIWGNSVEEVKKVAKKVKNLVSLYEIADNGDLVNEKG